jgi:hypothetical protein
MATRKEINEQLKIALSEIGSIEPWFDDEVREWVFAHRLYPVEYGGKTKEEVIENYPKYLREFIAHRLAGRLDLGMEKKTQGRGGLRPRAGRPKGTKRSLPTKVVRLEAQIADWVQQHKEDIYSLIVGEKVLAYSRHRSA